MFRLLIALSALISLTTAITVTQGMAHFRGQVSGVIYFTQQEGPEILVAGELEGMPEGLYGFHVHQYGDITTCTAAGAHFDIYGYDHAGPLAKRRHIGDLGNISFDANGRSVVNFTDAWIALNGEHSIIGRALMVHEGEDDLGVGFNADSLTTGNAGGRVDCAVVGVSEFYD